MLIYELLATLSWRRFITYSHARAQACYCAEQASKTPQSPCHHLSSSLEVIGSSARHVRVQYEDLLPVRQGQRYKNIEQTSDAFETFPQQIIWVSLFL